MSIKTNFEFPRGDDAEDLIIQGQRLSQDLSKNFKSIKKQLKVETQGISPVSLDGEYLSQSFSAPSGSLFATYTISHSLGSIPSSFIIADVTVSGPTNALIYSIFRLSWSTTDIVVRLNLTTGTGSALSGSFKILVLR